VIINERRLISIILLLNEMGL